MKPSCLLCIIHNFMLGSFAKLNWHNSTSLWIVIDFIILLPLRTKLLQSVTIHFGVE